MEWSQTTSVVTTTVMNTFDLPELKFQFFDLRERQADIRGQMRLPSQIAYSQLCRGYPSNLCHECSKPNSNDGVRCSRGKRKWILYLTIPLMGSPCRGRFNLLAEIAGGDGLGHFSDRSGHLLRSKTGDENNI